jgi:hypothetical protein
MSVPPVEYPAELAADCMQLFSRIVMGVRTMPARCSAVQIAYERMHAVIATPKPQPALRPMYRLVSDSAPPSTEPMRTARQVSWSMLSPRPR